MSLKRIVALIAAPCLLVVTLAEAGSVKDVYRKVSASVVQIETMDLVKKEGRGKANLTDSGLGSGVLISEDGATLGGVTLSHKDLVDQDTVVTFSGRAEIVAPPAPRIGCGTD